MIIIDFSQIIIAAVHIDAAHGEEISPDFIRHICFNTIRYYNKKFRDKYGETVIAVDYTKGGNWRKTISDAYKCRRGQGRAESAINWDEVYSTVNECIKGLEDHFPYRVVKVKTAEADDVIGALVHRYHSDGPIMIVSSDKDFKQLHKYPNVKQFSPLLKKLMYEPNPERYLIEHIIRGDAGDDIPNVFTRHDLFLNRQHKERQTPIYQKKMDVWVTQNPKDFLTEGELFRWNQNRCLIDLNYIPEEIKEQVVENYKSAKTEDTVYIYLMQNKLNNLLTYIEDFEVRGVENVSSLFNT